MFNIIDLNLFKKEAARQKYEKHQAEWELYKNDYGKRKQLEQSERKLLRVIYKIEMDEYLSVPSGYTVDKNDEYYRFFDAIIPENMGKARYFIQIQMPDYLNLSDGRRIVFILSYNSKTAVIKALRYLSRQDRFTVFYSNNSFILPGNKKHSHARNDFIKASQSIYIDIDDVPNIETVTPSTLETFLTHQYGLTKEQLPNAVVFSGHGLHLYYRTPYTDLTNEENRVMRNEIVCRILALFGADFSCLPVSHVVRVPGSNNLKQGKIVPTQLFIFDIDKVNEWDSFFWLPSSEETEEIHRRYIERVNEKRRNTLSCEVAEKETVLGKKKTYSEFGDAAECESQKTVDKMYNPSIGEYIRCGENARFSALMYDLTEYYRRNRGIEVGRRHNFMFIILAMCRTCNYEKGAARKFVMQYIAVNDKENRCEADKILNQLYGDTKKFKPLRNRTVANLLGLSADEMALWENTSFTSEEREKKNTDKRRISRKKYYEAQRIRERKYLNAEKKDIYFAVIAANSEKTNKELAKMLGCSIRTVQNYKSKLQAQMFRSLPPSSSFQ